MLITRVPCVGLLAPALGLALMLTSPAAATVTFPGTTTTPAKTVDASTKQLVYYLQMRSGPADERFSVRFSAPRFATLGPFDEGQSLDGPRAIALLGPGALGQQLQDARILEPCSDRDERFHGYATGAAAVDVSLPASSVTTLAIRYAAGHRPPWLDGDYRMTFTVQPQLVGSYGAASVFGAGATGVARTTIRTAGPKVAGRSGAHILLSTTPAGATKTGAAPRRVGRRTRIAIRGRVLPALGRRSVVLEWSHPGGTLHTLARLRTDSRGRFSFPAWRPGSAGTFELWARYPRQPGPLTSDRTSCPVVFAVR
jgi:hypothetical protein